MSDPTTESIIAADSERTRTTAAAVETDAEPSSLRAVAMVTPELLPAPVSVSVPTTRSLRMLLGVLKHNPAGAIREVGVLLMLYVSSIEVATAAGAAAAVDTPSAPPLSDGCTSGGKAGRRFQPRTKELRKSDHLKRRNEEAAAVLALATEDRRVGSLKPGSVTTPRLTKRNKTRFQHQLRQLTKVEDRLQGWAATRGREVSGLQELLSLSAGGGLSASPVDVRLVRDRAKRITVERVEKVRYRPCRLRKHVFLDR